MTIKNPTHQTRTSLIASSLAVLCVAASVLLGNAPVVRAASGQTLDPERGKLLFEKRCGGCHSLDVDKEGPRLRTVYGRKAGTVESFKYSLALKSAQVTWNDATLDKWLSDTESLVPDNDMDFHVADAGERAEIIRFLKLSSGK